ncbi:hypothetical protein [Thiothrix sp.]|jgi:hypothetical protein|uniref:hypothetical protein n=1 Tax=Thiothrix sp. TaxID=1032 RepID=UPI00257F33EC|nr:hypothetical protein [Thiothrix sp.]
MARSLINAAKQIAPESISLNLLAQSIQDSLAQVATNKTNIEDIIASKGAASGIATLDAGGKLNTNQLPALAIGDTVTVTTEAAMLALTTAEVKNGDVVVLNTGDIATQKTYCVVDSTKLDSLDGYRQLLFPEQGVAAIMRGGVAQTGQVSLAEVAFTGAAADLAFSNAGFIATNVSAALVELKAANDGLVEDIADVTDAVALKVSLADLKFNVALTGDIDGTNKVFALPEAAANDTLCVFWNGQMLKPTDDYSVSGTSVTMIGSPDAGDKVWANYVKAAA